MGGGWWVVVVGGGVQAGTGCHSGRKVGASQTEVGKQAGVLGGEPTYTSY